MRALGNDVLIVGPGDIADESFGHDPKALNRLKRMLPASIYEMLELCYNVPAYFRIRRAYNNFLPDFVYERNNLYLLAGIFLKMRTGVPLLLEVNAPLARERKNFGGLGLRGLAERLEQWVWQSADAVLPVTRVLANEMVAAGVAREKVEIVPNGIDSRKFANDDFDVKQKLHLTGNIVLGFTGFVRN